jgi:hypothetical protein
MHGNYIAFIFNPIYLIQGEGNEKSSTRISGFLKH